MATAHGYLILVEPASDGGYGVSTPDLPGCVAVGATRTEALQLMREAIEMHVAGMREDGEPVPVPTTEAEYVEVIG